MKKSLGLLISLIIGLGINLSLALGQEENKGTLIADSQYFSIYAEAPVDAYAVVSKLKFDYLRFGEKLTKGAEDDLAQILVKTIDGLYLEVSDIIDIHIYSFKGTIRVLPDRPSLEALLKKDYNLDFPERSLYYFEKNTIFISQADITLGMLGHEMAHAIISNFFVVPPPPKVQEILAGYVEYSLNKVHGS
ncbi:MAG: hypothetical protein NTY14_03390 [Candidatus Omnitrophica bacterium]|nr:hypothetical protein [Candidatus Omnitrophota bacterium]